jgi:hypothetical protein
MAGQLEEAPQAVFFLGRELQPAEDRNLDMFVKIPGSTGWPLGLEGGVTRPGKAAHFTGTSLAAVRMQS